MLGWIQRGRGVAVDPVRVAGVQLAFHPAARFGLRSPLEDPLYPDRPDVLEFVPEDAWGRRKELRARVRQAYEVQLAAKLRAIVATLRSWDVQVVVFPEYSVPWGCLPALAEAAGSMVVVAGTHGVELRRESKAIYQSLKVPAPTLGTSVSPVLADGRARRLVPKLSRSKWERSMTPGRGWQPVPLPSGLPGPLAVLICLDFLNRDEHRDEIGGLDEARFLAVPSSTPFSTTDEFAGKALEQARRYGRPVIYANDARQGGTSVFVDDGRSGDSRFPECIGQLEAGDEGVVIADVDLGFYPPGRSTRYRDGDEPPAVPFACASFVYRSVDADVAYAAVLDQLSDVLSRDGDPDVESVVSALHDAREVLRQAGTRGGGAARKSRLSLLIHELDGITQMEYVRRFTREVVLPAEVLPLPELRRGLAAGAGNAVCSWRDNGVIGHGLDQIQVRCRNATVGMGKDTLTPSGQRTREAVVERVGGARGPFTAVPLPPLGEWTVKVTPRPGRVGGGVDGLAADRVRLLTELQQLLEAEGAEETAVLYASRVGQEEAHSGRRGAALDVVVLLVHMVGVVRAVLPDSENLPAWEAVRLQVSPHYGISETEVVTRLERNERIAVLRSRFTGARDRATDTLARCVDKTVGHYVPARVRVDDADAVDGLAALDEWATARVRAPSAVVLGGPGAGKSTLLAAWAAREADPLRVLCQLASAGLSGDLWDLVVREAGAEPSPANRAAAGVLVRTGRLVPCFDGFDEWRADAVAADFPRMLTELFRLAADGGRVLVSCRDDYLPGSEAFETAMTQALPAGWSGPGRGYRRFDMELFGETQVQEFVRAVRGAGAGAALERITELDPPADLVRRPFLLGLLLDVVDALEPGSTVPNAYVFEQYLAGWLAQSGAEPTPGQKELVAERLAAHLWREGRSSCGGAELDRIVRDVSGGEPPENVGGPFYGRRGDSVRFSHRVFQDFFLARHVVRELVDRRFDVLDTEPFTPDVVEFVGQLLDGAYASPKDSEPVAALRRWLTEGRRVVARPDD
jgi:predicted amidohydrolase